MYDIKRTDKELSLANLLMVYLLSRLQLSRDTSSNISRTVKHYTDQMFFLIYQYFRDK